MPQVESKIKKWGNSFGVVIPTEVIKKEHFKEGENVSLIILKKSDVLKRTFGTLKLKKSAQKIKDELREELYDD